MDNKIAELSFDKFETYDEFDERLPKYRNNLIAHFPLDGTSENIVPEAEIYVEDNIIKTKGLIKDIIKTNSNVIVEDGAMKFTGDINCFLDLNTEILNTANDFCVEIKVKTTYDNAINCILHGARAGEGHANEFSLITRNKDKILYTDMNNVLPESENSSDPYTSYILSNPGEINTNEYYTMKIIRRKGILTSYINDSFKKQYRVYGELKIDRLVLGQEIDDPIDTRTFDPTQSLIGYIEYIKFYRYEKLFLNSPEINNMGYVGVGIEQTKNINDKELYIYNNFKVPASLTPTKNKIFGHDTRILSLTINTNDALNAINTGNSANGCHSTKSFTFKANKKYCAYIFFKPISHRDLVMQGTASNIPGWEPGHITKLEDGWYMYYQYRDGTTTEDKTDLVFMSYKCNTIKLNESAVMEVSPIIVLEDIEVPTSFDIGYETTKETIKGNISGIRFINPIINDFSICLEWKMLAHTTYHDYPQMLWLGGWSGDKSEDWIGLYRGKAWGPDYFHADIICKSTGFLDKIFINNNMNTRIGHNFYIGLSYNKQQKKVCLIIYDKTTNQYLANEEKIYPEALLENFSALRLNYDNGDIVRNVSIYNKALSNNELKENFIDKFAIKEQGNISLNKIKESIPNVPKNDIYYAPLDISTKTVCERLNRIPTCAAPSYVNGGAFCGNINAELIIDLTRNSLASSISESWNKDLHSDAYSLSGWNSGYNSGVSNADKVYHAKWVKEGPTGNIAAKFIDYNGKTNDAHNWLGVFKHIEPTEFGLFNTCTTGTKITVIFKAKAEKTDSKIRVGFYRNQKSNDKYEFGPQLKDILLTTSWKEYSADFIVDDDWNLTKWAQLYFYGYHSSFETIIWATDVVLIKNGPNMSSELAYNYKPNQTIKYNLNGTIGLDWSKPWTICYWRKAIGPSNNHYHLDSLGAGGMSDKSYAFWGHSPSVGAVDFCGSSTPIDDNAYYNKWLFISIRYDGTNIYTHHMGEKIKTKIQLAFSPAANGFYIPELECDLTLGGYKYTSAQESYSTHYRDLVVIKNECLTEEELKTLAGIKLSYKQNELIANCELIENSIKDKRKSNVFITEDENNLITEDEFNFELE